MTITIDSTMLTSEEKATLDRIIDNGNGKVFADTTEAFAHTTAESESFPNNTDYVIDRVEYEIKQYLYYGDEFLKFVRNEVDRAVEDDDELRESEREAS